ncbi:MAG: FAD-binding protein [Thermodesulfobacteriota bacterium]
MEKIECDVLVIGAGGAGLRAAIEAKETFKRGKTLLVTKGALGESGVTATACSDRMAFHATLPHTEPREPDHWKYHAEDIYRIGGYVSDGDLAEILAKESQTAFEYLDALGVPFVRNKDGLVDQFITDGSEYPRACYTGPRTANHIEEALVKKVSSMDIMVIEHCMISKLLTYRGRVVGAIGFDEREEGEIEERIRIFSTKTTILATGGAGEVFKFHVFPQGMTGDGYALAYRAGAELVNMEFIQIGPSSVKTRLNCSGSLMRAVPRLINEKGEEFLKNYLPKDMSLAEIGNLIFEKGSSWPVSLEKRTHLIDVAIFKEILSGKKIFLDYKTNPEGFRFKDLDPKWKERYEREVKTPISHEEREKSAFNRLSEINPESIEWLKEHGIDISKGEFIEIAPCIQHFQGGVKIRTYGETSLKGLYAVGECAGGQHGANRPGGNALLDGQVFGRRAGNEAATEAKRVKRQKISLNQIQSYLKELGKGEKGEKASKIREEIQSLSFQFASVVRTEEGLKEGLQILKSLRARGIKEDEKGLIYKLETKNLMDVAEMILRASLYRKESRGPHLFFHRFEDLFPLPSKDPQWRNYIVIQKQGERMILKKRAPVPLFL